MDMMGDDVEFDYQQSKSEDDESSFEQLQQHQTPPTVFNKPRHLETIKGIEIEKQSWRMKERMKTVSVALVMCLNVGVDPPDIVKPQPCSKLECWIDPLSLPPQKALESIGANLLKQYERWQPRARYKQVLDPTVEEVKKLCTSLRRNAKDDRVLFHYNGHGVPKPTVNGEIWVFNRSYTQYIPLSVYDLQQWMGAPSIYVYDCSCAGLIVESFKQFAVQHEREYEMNIQSGANSTSFSSPPQYKNCIQLAACASDQLLPTNPDLPADLFTSCLTTPIKIALRWFIHQNAKQLPSGINFDIIEKIPGQLTDRRTMLGELNWIFTAITDTIAWNVLPIDLFQKLFRQDLLVASLFRNFLLAERIMRSYDCTPVASPSLPPTYHHPMWRAWDLAVDICLSQLPAILDGTAQYQHSSFFSEQLTAFQVWLSYGRPDSNPEQLPIVLQVLLSQVHRSRALDLLGKFLDLGPWAVNLALSVGIFPYVLKLLQSNARELRPLLVFIWAKILAVDSSCQTEIVRDNGHRYFLNVLSDPNIFYKHRTMAAFILASIVKNYRKGQEVAIQGSGLIDFCVFNLDHLDDNYIDDKLRQWLAICLGRIWENFDDARWIGARNNADEKLFLLLEDPVPDVRAAAVFALGTFVNSCYDRTDHANDLDHRIANTLIMKVLHDSSPVVRNELIIALQWFVLIFESQFLLLAKQYFEENTKDTPANQKEQFNAHLDNIINTLIIGTPPLRKVASRDRLSALNKFLNVPTPNTSNYNLQFGEGTTPPNNSHILNRVNSSASLSSYSLKSSGQLIGPANRTIWNALITLSNDAHPEVASLAQIVIDEIKSRLQQNNDPRESHSEPSFSEPASPNTHHSYMSESPNNRDTNNSSNTIAPTRNTTPVRENAISCRNHMTSPHPSAFSARKRTIFGREPSISAKSEDGLEDANSSGIREPIVTTNFVDWCSKQFTRPIFYPELNPESHNYQQKEWHSLRISAIREQSLCELTKIDSSKIEEQLFQERNPNIPQLILFHPYEPRIVVAERESFSVWDWDALNQPSIAPRLMGSFSNLNSLPTRIYSMQLVDLHDNSKLMLACDDGTVRVWRNCGLHDEYPQPELVTAFHMFTDMVPTAKGGGIVLHWNQTEQKLIASGETRSIRLWDAVKEMKIRDYSTGTESSVTSMTSNDGNLICVGCKDGSVRVFDDRLMPQDSRVLTFYEQKSWILDVHIYPNEGNVHILSGSLSGEIKWYDKRWPNPIKSINTGIGMTSMSVHPESDVFACGLANQALPSGYQSINIYTLDGIPGCTLRHFDGYMSQRIGPVCSLAFHPLKAILAAGSTDNNISLYGVRNN